MASLDHEAIRKAHPDAVTINDSTGAFDKYGKSIILDTVKIATARTDLDKEAAAVKYRTDRTSGPQPYASYGDQLDMLYKDIVAGKVTTAGTWATHVKAVKDANPKP